MYYINSKYIEMIFAGEAASQDETAGPLVKVTHDQTGDEFSEHQFLMKLVASKIVFMNYNDNLVIWNKLSVRLIPSVR